MNTEVKAKRNPDYSQSAVNLCNPPEVLELLKNYHSTQTVIDNLDAVLKAYPEYEQMIEQQQKLAELRKDIEKAIEQYGSYQEIQFGCYALKQRAITVCYLAEAVHKHLNPAMVAAVIVESVDKATVEALVKAGRISLEEQELISQKTEVYKFIIR